jgi:hypothetical protein
MTDLKPQWIVEQLNTITISTLTKKAELVKKQEELKQIDVYNEIQDLEFELKELDKQDKEIREQWKMILMESWVKKFEAIDGTIIQLNKKPWKLVIEHEDDIPEEFYKEKTTKTLDKKKVKDEISEWCVFDGCYIQEDYNLVIKNK